jgi:ELWxxDGT repeat protein
MVSRSPRQSLLFSCALWAALVPAIVPAAAAQPFQVADVNPTRELPPLFVFVSEPMVSLGGELFFTQDDGVHGPELWKTDGTPGNEVLLADLCPGACGSMPKALTRVGNRLVFFADDGEHGFEIWSTDGTAAGTSMIADLWPGPVGGGDTRWALEMGGAVYFPGNDRLHGYELWKTDGTAAGTLLVADLRPGPEGSLPIPKVTAGGLLLFNADDGTHGREPWLTDGTAAGTRLVKDVNPGAGWSTYVEPPLGGANDWLATSGGLFLFQAQDATHGLELWASDGTEAGTILLRDFYPGGTGGLPNELTELAGTVYFSAATETQGYELWRTDGTPAGTSLVKEIRPGDLGSSPRNLTVVSGRLFFRAFADGAGTELWTSDGTEAGTTLVKDIRPGDQGSILFHDPALTDFAGTLLFLADDGVNGLEIWKSDGTEAGTVLITDFSSQAVPMQIYIRARLAPFEGRMVFRAFDQDQEVDLWATDGTAAGTMKIVETTSLTSSILLSPWDGKVMEPTAWGPLGDQLLLLADDGTTGNEPWVSDGTAMGTQQLAETYPGPDWSSFRSLTPLTNGGALFSNGILWKTDGTPAGTHPLVPDGLSSVAELTRIGETVFFSGSSSDAGQELWKTDGTFAGTGGVADFLQGTAGSSPYRLTAVGNTLFFVARLGTDPVNQELWKSDGTAAGTVLVKDIHPGTASSVPDRLTQVAERLFFSAEDSMHGRELWKSNGTAAGTVLVKDIVPGPASSMEETFDRDATAVLGSTFFFVADDLASGAELWASDGTEAGTRQVRDIRPGLRGAEPQALTVAGGRLFFSADDGTHGRELWVSDGTEAGTSLVEDIVPGAASSLPRELAAIDNRLVFSAFDEAAGVEPWASDGTADGTRRLGDIAPGPLPSSPVRFTAAGENVYFGANDAVTGSELWAIPQDEIDPGLDFYTVAPCRAIDTRTSSPLISGVAQTFVVAGACGVPADAQAVAVNLTVFGPTALGNVVAWPAGAPVPGTSSVNFLAGVNRANNGIVELSGGEIQALARMMAGGEVHLILDVVGYFR